jgi:hypothetical protein
VVVVGAIVVVGAVVVVVAARVVVVEGPAAVPLAEAHAVSRSTRRLAAARLIPSRLRIVHR